MRQLVIYAEWFAQSLWWLIFSIVMVLMESVGRFLGTIGLAAAGALIYEGCGKEKGVLCQPPGGVAKIELFGVYIGDDYQMTGFGILAFIVAASWLPLGWSAVDLVSVAALVAIQYE